MAKVSELDLEELRKSIAENKLVLARAWQRIQELEAQIETGRQNAKTSVDQQEMRRTPPSDFIKIKFAGEDETPSGDLHFCIGSGRQRTLSPTVKHPPALSRGDVAGHGCNTHVHFLFAG